MLEELQRRNFAAILFESAGLGRSTGDVPQSMSGMAAHALAFSDALGLKRVDILGYSLAKTTLLAGGWNS
jgi:pimeloyl-ACP methyl ester carboxylesterase